RHVPLDVVPGVGSEMRAGDRGLDPVARGFVPGVPITTAVIALAADHIVVAADELEGIKLQRLPIAQRIVVDVEPEIPKEIADVVVGAELLYPQRISPHAIVVELGGRAVARGRSLVLRHPVGALSAAAGTS